jgi:MFS family permease
MQERDAGGLRRDLRAMVGDGIAFSAMVGLGETYVPAFSLAVGLGDVVAGLLATLPMLAGGCLQLATPWAVVRLGSYRRWVVLCARLQAASFAPLLIGALRGSLSVGWVFGAAAAYWGFGMATGPAWNAWAGVLVPAPRRARFFAQRSRWAQAGLLLAILAGGAILDAGRLAERRLLAFAAIFALAASARVVSSAFLASQSEPPGLVAGARPAPPWRALQGLRGSPARRVLAYLLGVQVAVNVAAPFFTPFMLGPLALSYAGYTVLMATALVSRIAVLPLLGRLAHVRGNRAVLWLGAMGIVPLPALWLVSSSYAYLMAVQVASGAAWAALELSTLLSFLEDLDLRERAGVLTAFNFANAGAMMLGSVAGAHLLSALGGGGRAYAALFAVSSLARLASLALLPRVPLPAAAARPAPLRTLAVRPSVGAVERPVLPALPGGEDDASR